MVNICTEQFIAVIGVAIMSAVLLSMLGLDLISTRRPRRTLRDRRETPRISETDRQKARSAQNGTRMFKAQMQLERSRLALNKHVREIRKAIAYYNQQEHKDPALRRKIYLAIEQAESILSRMEAKPV